MNEFEIWLYRGVILILLAIVWWFGRGFFRKVIDRLDELIVAMTSHNERINQVEKTQIDHAHRLNDHSDRIRKIEIDNAKK